MYLNRNSEATRIYNVRTTARSIERKLQESGVLLGHTELENYSSEHDVAALELNMLQDVGGKCMRLAFFAPASSSAAAEAIPPPTPWMVKVKMSCWLISSKSETLTEA